MKKSPTPSTVQKPRKAFAPRRSGQLTTAEKQNLVLAAKDAFSHQVKLHRVEPGDDFENWRRNQVMDCVGLLGVSKLSRVHFRQVKAHFLALAGRDDEAFALLRKTGRKRDHGDAEDTHETCEEIVTHIQAALADHAQFPAELLAGGKRHIHPGWVLKAARQRAAMPSLTMEEMATRLDPATLRGLRAHTLNHIREREGRDAPELRGPRIYPPRKDPGSMHEDPPAGCPPVF